MSRRVTARLARFRWGIALLSAWMGVCLGCREPVTPYLHVVHVESLDLSEHPQASVTARFTTDDGEEAAPPSFSSLRVMADGKEEAKGLDWVPVPGLGAWVILVVDPSLGPALVDAQLALYRQLLGAFKGSDRAALIVSTQTLPPALEWLPAAQALKELTTLVGSTAAPPSKGLSHKISRARVPRGLIEQGLTRLGKVEGGRGRRALVLPVFGAATGAGWKAVSARAASEGAMVAVLGFARPGGLPPRARTVAPVYGFPIDLAHSLEKTGNALKELLFGGYGATFRARGDALSLASGFALRVVLPRDGWEEFRPATLEVFPGRVFLDGLRSTGPGRCALRTRVADAIGRPLSPAAGEVAVYQDHRTWLADEVKLDDEPVVVAVAVDRLGVRDGDALLKSSLAEALLGMRPQDQAILISPGGGASGRPQALGRAEAAAAARALQLPASRRLSGLITRLEEAKRRLDDVPAGQRRALLVVSGAAPLRIAERGAGPAPRFRRLLISLRQGGVVPVWVVMAPTPRVEQLGAELRARSGQILAVEKAGELRQRIATGLSLATSGMRLGFACDDARLDALASTIRASAVVRGRLAVSKKGAPRLGSSAPLEP